MPSKSQNILHFMLYMHELLCIHMPADHPITLTAFKLCLKYITFILLQLGFDEM